MMRKIVAGGLAVCLVSASGTTWAGRPLNINDADALDSGKWQVESGIGYMKDGDCRYREYPIGLTFGALPDIEIGIGVGAVSYECAGGAVSESGVGDASLGAKWKVLAESDWRPAFALAPSVTIPTGDETRGLGSGKSDVDLTLVLSSSLSDVTSLHFNAGYTWAGTSSNVIHYGLALDFQLAARAQWVAEVFAEQEYANRAETNWQYNTGLRWMATETVTFDVGIGTGIGNDAPDLAATLGITWVIGN